ncbi:hypothetical protein [Wenyingzhuangia marina]|uniref:hypothetical protein n=1 Tax=Wenyingzhuangia marina TaxID=1195760 RepID=UPI0009349809|nr:hypothetical protein [Wenyingzhuangia marina]GGF61125.1 hypothetical protein GCM10011397_00280 [Wenyingzhuangia marina]
MVTDIITGTGEDLFITEIAKEIKPIETIVIPIEQIVHLTTNTTIQTVITPTTVIANITIITIQIQQDHTEELVVHKTQTIPKQKDLTPQHKQVLLVTTEAQIHQATIVVTAQVDHTEAIAIAIGDVKNKSYEKTLILLPALPFRLSSTGTDL